MLLYKNYLIIIVGFFGTSVEPENTAVGRQIYSSKQRLEDNF